LGNKIAWGDGLPKHAQYTLAFSAELNAYELREDSQAVPMLAAAWASWLSEHGSFSFKGRSGQLSLLKERRKAGFGYWYAYRSQGVRTAKRYAGRSSELTFARLETLAQILGDNGARSLIPQPQSEVVTGAKPAEIAIPEPLLAPKIQPPHLHSSLVRRARLLAQLDAGREGKLIVVSAPAGFGKTTLVRQWLDEAVQQGVVSPVAWLSLGVSDNDPLRFWRYLITACRSLGADVGLQSLALLESPISLRSPVEMIMTAFVNELAQTRISSIIVLEDYHVITAPLIHEAVSFLLDHLPVHLHLLLITRTNPPLPLARLRVAGELTEIDAPDLRFSEAETVTFLQQTTALAVPPAEIVQVVSRIEGWAAGLRLLALALQGRQDTGAINIVLANFVAGRRGIGDYFVTEVLNNQSETLQLFLLQTSFLGNLTASLCDSVTERNNSQALLELLEQANLFLEPLDGVGLWYRYHALFATAMQNEARRQLGDRAVRDLLTRAGSWYEVHGKLDEAIEAAFATDNIPRAAELIAQVAEAQFSFAGTVMHGPPEFYTLQLWLNRLPSATRDEQPLLNMALAIAMIFTNIVEMQPTNSTTVNDVERLLVKAESGFIARGETGRLGQLYAFRALVFRERGEIINAVGRAKTALDLLSLTDLNWRGICISTLGLGEENAGHLAAAAARFEEACAMCESIDNRPFARANTVMLGWVYLEQNEPYRAGILFQQILAEARAMGDLDDVGHTLHGLAEIALCWNDLHAARAQAEEVVEVFSQYTHEPSHIAAVLILARLDQAQGQSEAALARCSVLLSGRTAATLTAERRINATITFEQACIALATGDIAAVQRWRANRLPDLERPWLALCREEILLARLFIAEGNPGAATILLEARLADAELRGQKRVALEIRVLLTVAYVASDQLTNARQLLIIALTMAHPANALRVFVDDGQILLPLLQDILPGLEGKNLITFSKTILRAIRNTTVAATPSETLSQQERRVLHLIANGSSNTEIAANLVVSVNTVKAHVKNIYRKLKLSSRLEAANAAREMGLQ
jgi:LuxR family maltose regulon positive regulatory protein